MQKQLKHVLQYFLKEFKDNFFAQRIRRKNNFLFYCSFVRDVNQMFWFCRRNLRKK